MNIFGGVFSLLSTLVGLALGVVLVLCFGTIKSYLLNRAKKIAAPAINEAAEKTGYSGVQIVADKVTSSVDNTYTKSTLLAKLKYDLQPVKLLTSSLRLLIVAIAVAGAVYAYGYWRGTTNAPVKFDMRGKEAIIRLNEHYMKITPDGSAYVLDKDKRILKQIRVKDIPGLEKALKPYGIDLKPFAAFGGGVGDGKAKLEAGLGIQVIKFYRWYLNAFVTNKGAYVGPSYRLTENCDANIGVGKGFKGDNRVHIGVKFRFD